MDSQKIVDIPRLIYKKITGNSTSDEDLVLNEWRNSAPAYEALFQKYADNNYLSEGYELYKMIDPTRPAVDMKERIAREQRATKKIMWRRLSSVAAVLLLLLTCVWSIYYFRGRNEPVSTTAMAVIQHGEAKALLTLEDGKTVELNAAQQKIVEDDRLVTKVENGNLTYQARKNIGGKLVYNNLYVPRGGEFKVILDDGTEVWLNSDSRLKYPVAFVGKERRVFLEGEAYFRVTSDKQKPFFVESANQEVKVLGTEFNIAAYKEDDAVYTTLAEGLVSLHASGKAGAEVNLTPGYQAVFSKQTQNIRVEQVDVDEMVSWRTGMFVFENQMLEQIMQKLARWYNFTYSIEGEAIKKVQFKGKVPRYGDFKDVLLIIEKSGGLTVQVTGNNITIKEKK